jgi:DNA-binding response OmpR family regulator
MIATTTRNIVLVEDDSSAANLIREAIALEGDPSWNLRVITDGTNAAAAIAAAPPDLVLLDLMLPGADGGAIFRALRACPQTHDTPVLFLSGGTTRDLHEHGIEEGVLLRKPVNLGVLLHVLRTHLGAAES